VDYRIVSEEHRSRRQLNNCKQLAIYNLAKTNTEELANPLRYCRLFAVSHQVLGDTLPKSEKLTGKTWTNWNPSAATGSHSHFNRQEPISWDQDWNYSQSHRGSSTSGGGRGYDNRPRADSANRTHWGKGRDGRRNNYTSVTFAMLGLSTVADAVTTASDENTNMAPMFNPDNWTWGWICLYAFTFFVASLLLYFRSCFTETQRHNIGDGFRIGLALCGLRTDRIDALLDNLFVRCDYSESTTQAVLDGAQQQIQAALDPLKVEVARLSGEQVTFHSDLMEIKEQVNLLVRTLIPVSSSSSVPATAEQPKISDPKPKRRLSLVSRVDAEEHRRAALLRMRLDSTRQIPHTFLQYWMQHNSGSPIERCEFQLTREGIVHFVRDQHANQPDLFDGYTFKHNRAGRTICYHINQGGIQPNPTWSYTIERDAISSVSHDKYGVCSDPDNRDRHPPKMSSLSDVGSTAQMRHIANYIQANPCLNRRARWALEYDSPWHGLEFTDINFCSLCGQITCQTCMTGLMIDYAQALCNNAIITPSDMDTLLTADVPVDFRLNVCRVCIAGRDINHFRTQLLDITIRKLPFQWW